MAQYEVSVYAHRGAQHVVTSRFPNLKGATASFHRAVKNWIEDTNATVLLCRTSGNVGVGTVPASKDTDGSSAVFHPAFYDIAG